MVVSSAAPLYKASGGDRTAIAAREVEPLRPLPHDTVRSSILRLGYRKGVLLFAKVTKIGGAEKAQSEVKRQHGLQDQRTVDIDPLLKDKLEKQAKKYALTTPNNGLIPTIKYWARGRLPSVLQLIIGLIAHFEASSS